MLARLGLRLRVFLLFAGLGAGAVAVLSLGLVFAYQRFAAPEALNAFVQAGIVGALGGLGLITWVWFLFDVNVARPIDLLAGALRARAHTDIDAGLDQTSVRYLGDLGPAASRRCCLTCRSELCCVRARINLCSTTVRRPI